MAIPTNAYVFDQEMDPKDQVDFLADCASAAIPILEAGETIASYTLALGAEAAALGLTIGTSTYAPSLITSNKVKFWLTVDNAFQANAAFNGAGTKLPVELTITTNSAPARTRQRTLVVKVAQQ